MLGAAAAGIVGLNSTKDRLFVSYTAFAHFLLLHLSISVVEILVIFLVFVTMANFFLTISKNVLMC